jgi:hypothetical protein
MTPALVDTYGDLPADLQPHDVGTAFIVKRDGLMYVWNGADWPYNGSGQTVRVDSRILEGNTMVETVTTNPDDDGNVQNADTIVNNESGANDNPAADAPGDEATQADGDNGQADADAEDAPKE